jgi:hypothetical protein
VRCINDYLKRHPGATCSTVRAALLAAEDAVELAATEADEE